MTAVAATVVVTQVGSAFPPASSDRGMIPFGFEYTFLGTEFDHADDELVVFGPMPDVAYIKNAPNSVVLDFGAAISTTDLDITYGFGTVAGVISKQLYTGDDIGQTTATNYPSVALAGEGGWIDVGGLYFVIVVDEASTTPITTGVTLAVGGEYTQNVLIGSGS